MEGEVNEMEQKLDLILQKLETLEVGQNEIQQVVKAIHNRQEVTDAKLESLTMDVHKIHGSIGALKGEIEFTFEKTSKNELEIFRLRQEN